MCSAEARDPCAERATVLPIPSFIIYIQQLPYHVNTSFTVKVKIIEVKIQRVFVNSYILGIFALASRSLGKVISLNLIAMTSP